MQFSFMPTNTASQIGELSTLAFDFGMTQQEGDQFFSVLQDTLTQLQEGNLTNQEIADSLQFIKQNVPDELMTQIKQELNLDESFEETEDELSAQAFAVFNLVDNIIKDIENIESKSQLANSMTQCGISKQNIDNTFEILEKTPKQENSLTPVITKNETPIIPNKALEQFTANQKLNSQFLAEDISVGKKIETPVIDNKNILPAEPTNTDGIEIPAELTQSAKKEPQTLAQMLDLFKKTKQVATDKGLNLNTENKATVTDNVISNEVTEKTIKQEPTAITATETINNVKAPIINDNIQVKNTNKATHGELTKSEYKDLTAKFISTDSEVKTSTEETSVEPTQVFAKHATVNQTASNTAFEQKLNFNTNVTNEIADSIELENIEKANNTQQAQENKAPTSNFNAQLYKMAQQANVQNQVNVAIKNLKDNMQQIKIKLNPEELGNISIEMEIVESAARGVITVERPEVAQQLAQNLKDIFANFKQANVNVEDIVVKVSDNPDEQGNQQNQQNNDQITEIEYTFNENDLVDISV